MSGVGRPAGQKDKAPRKPRGDADRARALARAASSAGPGASLASFLSRGGSAGSSGDAPAAAPAVAAPPDAEMEETTVVEEFAPGSGGLPSGPPGAPRPPDLQPDPVVPEVRPGTDGGDQEEADAAGHDAGAADGPEQRADPEREDAEDAFIDDDDDDNELEDSPQKTLLAAMAKRLQAELSSRGTLTDDWLLAHLKRNEFWVRKAHIQEVRLPCRCQ